VLLWDVLTHTSDGNPRLCQQIMAAKIATTETHVSFFNLTFEPPSYTYDIIVGFTTHFKLRIREFCIIHHICMI
jgi:hypothetical protein